MPPRYFLANIAFRRFLLWVVLLIVGPVFSVTLFFSLGFFFERPPNSLQAQPVPVVIQHAVIDESRLAKRVQDLKDGETAYAAPDTMVVDESKKCWVNPYAVVGEDDTKFKVMKKSDGYHVEVTDKGLRWSRVPLEIAVPDVALRSKFVPVRTLKAEILK